MALEVTSGDGLSTLQDPWTPLLYLNRQGENCRPCFTVQAKNNGDFRNETGMQRLQSRAKQSQMFRWGEWVVTQTRATTLPSLLHLLVSGILFRNRSSSRSGSIASTDRESSPYPVAGSVDLLTGCHC